MNDCKFCSLLASGALFQRLPNLVLETDRAIAVVNRRPCARGHVTIILRRHLTHTSDLQDDDLQVGTLLGRIARILERLLEPQRVILIGDGKPSAHLHFHLLPEPPGVSLDLAVAVADLNLPLRENTLSDIETAALVRDLRSALAFA